MSQSMHPKLTKNGKFQTNFRLVQYMDTICWLHILSMGSGTFLTSFKYRMLTLPQVYNLTNKNITFSNVIQVKYY